MSFSILPLMQSTPVMDSLATAAPVVVTPAAELPVEEAASGWGAVFEALKDSFSDFGDGIVAFLPSVVSALVVFFVGWIVAKVLRKIVVRSLMSIGLDAAVTKAGFDKMLNKIKPNLSAAAVLGSILYWLVMLMVITITALNQAGVDTSIISSNLTIILGAILLAFATAYALGSWRIVRNMLSSFYTKGKYQTGTRIRVGEHEGEIVDIDSISVTIRTSEGKVVLPASVLVEEQVILKD